MGSNLVVFSMALIGAWIIQMFLHYKQVKHVTDKIGYYRKAGYIVGLGQERRGFGKGTIILICANNYGQIAIAERITGVTVFARFKEYKPVIGQNVLEIINGENSFKHTNALKRACEQISKRIKEDTNGIIS